MPIEIPLLIFTALDMDKSDVAKAQNFDWAYFRWEGRVTRILLVNNRRDGLIGYRIDVKKISTDKLPFTSVDLEVEDYIITLQVPMDAYKSLIKVYNILGILSSGIEELSGFSSTAHERMEWKKIHESITRKNRQIL